MPPPRTRLDSWKEIAQYLRRYERTVQRWELKWGLPVHRLPNAKSGGVFAYTDELDAWMTQTSALKEGEPGEHEHAVEHEHAIEHELAIEDEPGAKVDDVPVPAGASEEESQPAALVAPPRISRFHGVLLWSGLANLFLVACVLVACYFAFGRSEIATGNRNSLQVRQLTFRRGSVRAARFRPDGANIVYEATWDGSNTSLYESSVDQAEYSPLRSSGAQLLAVSRSSTLAILLNPQFSGAIMQTGTLAVQGLYQDKPQVITQNVGWADWAPDGSTLYYTVSGRNKNFWIEAYSLETQQTRRIYPAADTPPQWYSHVRVSPKGDWLAFEQHHGLGGELGGRIALLKLSGGTPKLSRQFDSIAGLAWEPHGNEVWFTAADRGLIRDIHAISKSGRERLIYQAAVTLTLQDISKSGEVLVTRDMASSGVFTRKLEKGANEVDLSLFSWSALGDISDDGKRVAILESGDAVPEPGVYLRDTTGGPARALGEAIAPVSLSPDGSTALALSNETCPRVVLLSVEQRPQFLTRANFCADHAVWTPDGHSFIFNAAESGHSPRCYIEKLGGAETHPITEVGTRCYMTSPDGRYVMVQKGDGTFKMSMDGSGPLVKLQLPAGSMPVRWLADNRIVVTNGPALSLSIIDPITNGTKNETIDLASQTEDRVPLSIGVSADLKTVAYSTYGFKSDLLMIHGLQ
jgi:Tol biopolymer transport system component